MISIRDSIPTEDIIRAYMDESVEEEEQVIIEDIPTNHETPAPTPIDEPIISEPESENKELVVDNSEEKKEDPPVELGIRDLDDEKVVTKLSFNDMDSVLDTDNNVSSIEAPKTIERLEEISTSRALERRMEQEEEDDDEALKISDEIINLNDFEDVSSVIKVN